MKKIRIASRGSKLAMAQSEQIRDMLLNLSSDLEITIVKVSTRGDRDKSDFLHKSSSVGFFTSEVENAILDGRADMAVHSLKDLPTAYRAGLVVAAIPQRQSPADGLLASAKVTSIEDLPAGATVGTSSLRRIAQLRHIRDDLECVPLRGNIETRVSKVASGKVDAIVVACAGLNRLGLADKISAILPLEEFLPAPGQGALGVQIREDNSELAELVSQINDRDSRITAEAEREVLKATHGGCSIPLGAYAKISGDTITIDAVISDIQGHGFVKLSKTTPLKQAKTCAGELAQELLNAGGKEILEKLKKK
jgi:hydroxymethylbilane synthase